MPGLARARSLAARAVVALVAAALAGCSAPESLRTDPTPGSPPATAARPATPAGTGTSSPAAPTVAAPPPAPARATFDPRGALGTVRVLAGGIGPREATSVAYRRAATYVEQRLRGLGYPVRRQPVRVPAGVSWGVPVPAGQSWNVVATPPGADLSSPYVLVGAHLDTVPQAPGAEDNASGVAVLLELARLARAAPPAVPVVFVAFAAEEPRGAGDDRHHYGSRRYVAAMPPAQRRALRGMVSLDRVGVGSSVPVCVGGSAGPALQRAVLAAARRVEVPARPCTNRASDHWSFEKARLAAVRLGSTPYPEYHSARDRPEVVRVAQLDRVGRVAWNWLNGVR